MARGLGLVIGEMPKVFNSVLGVTGISEKIRIGYEPPSKYQPSTKEEVPSPKWSLVIATDLG